MANLKVVFYCVGHIFGIFRKSKRDHGSFVLPYFILFFYYFFTTSREYFSPMKKPLDATEGATKVQPKIVCN